MCSADELTFGLDSNVAKCNCSTPKLTHSIHSHSIPLYLSPPFFLILFLLLSVCVSVVYIVTCCMCLLLAIVDIYVFCLDLFVGVCIRT